ncbi:MAG: hypothetical protein R3B70_33230 [Polyangiaceae bacterium]
MKLAYKLIAAVTAIVLVGISVYAAMRVQRSRGCSRRTCSAITGAREGAGLRRWKLVAAEAGDERAARMLELANRSGEG